MCFENTRKLEKNFIELSEKQKEKKTKNQTNDEPDYSLCSAFPLSSLLIHWRQGMP